MQAKNEFGKFFSDERKILWKSRLLHEVDNSSATTNPPVIDWGQWWTYDGISGPNFWGIINPEWSMCQRGRRQSPINIDPRTLLYDPNLTPFTLDKTTVGGLLTNTGHSVEWRVSQGSGMQAINVTGGPLSYVYTVSHARLHFGESNQQGSEHLLDNRAFPAELQIYAFNSQLYKNFSQAVGSVYGVVAIAVLIKIDERTTSEFRVMLEGVEQDQIHHGGSSTTVRPLLLSELLPTTDHYLTYDGSLTEPACHETVTWLVPNKPLYISKSLMERLRRLRQGRSDPLKNAPIANNFRPVQDAHHRTVRTNIHFPGAQIWKELCSVNGYGSGNGDGNFYLWYLCIVLGYGMEVVMVDFSG
ncbi:carbonic anhydrase-related protein 10-like [Oratosquilla oratoria]|uniref:carbonic anhydrase-related protein 10-like n=1 Tax=Oratosquilla oratoria TaxID=337810 RepID=UPI003F764BC5